MPQWFKDDGKLRLEICQRAGTTCCACGPATYSMKFKGIWNKETHPKDFPTRSFPRWGNLIGATHSQTFYLYHYNTIVSTFMKEAAEWDFAAKLLRDIISNKNRRVFDYFTIRSNFDIHQTEAVSFTVDQMHHLVSFVRKISPSPDWFVGMDSLDLCKSDCNWRDSLIVNLTLLDAGTDDGISYTSPNHPTEPQKTVQKITALFSNNSSSPFYVNGAHSSIPPFAQITFEKISTATCTRTVEISVRDRCTVSQWTKWSSCSASCGAGQRRRHRHIIGNPNLNLNQCPILIQTQSCLTAPCPTEGTACKVTEWSQWTPCPTICDTLAQQLKSRTRHIIKAGLKMKCPPTKEIIQHNKECIDRCSIKDCVVSEWTEWSPCSCNTTHTTRKRAILQQPQNNGKKCPNLEESKAFDEACLDKCKPVKCIVSEWGTWSSCPRICNANFNKTRTRTVERPASNGGKPCPALKQTKRCKYKCPEELINCMQWSPWSECTRTCGKGYKYRFRNQKPNANGRPPCPVLDQRKLCKLPECGKVKCQVNEWTTWSTCSKTCGRGFRTRKRDIVVMPPEGESRCPIVVEVEPCNSQNCPIVK
ncbi:uncharacterized protein TRIADDRAFT_61837 [Trichoplax adhaerens]|uniref:Spondin domain-containing protein n=1 Tax=Trichoplax adhaerens TaxID=10228 RepID=B3SC37_TRIAD|nr:hypothetical protein TRIADDRAFT_61837 [Trichoplax adhaerens]EDV19784.1 hypothetical protein TRIADDRAFT_61837 [Trichoplax adhaerens]|eukprot:XP_002117808.1 hypothetical protein TRIADDRAFT_61837 [Trichoplax adhaerens]